MPVYFAGGEDGDYTYINGSIGANFNIDTTSARYRSAWCRYGITVLGASPPAQLKAIWTSAQSSVWFHAQIWCNNVNYSDPLQGIVQFIDSSGIVRLQMIPSSGGGPQETYNFYKVDSSGTKTLLFTTVEGFLQGPSAPQTLDININYSTTGSIAVFINGSNVGSCTGVDVTTNSVTALQGHLLASYQETQYEYVTWSENIVRSESTLSLSGVMSFVPDAAGTLQQWTGTVSEIDGTTVNQSSPNTSTTSGQIQQYDTSTGTISSSLNVTSITISAQVTADSSSPVQHIEMVCNITGTNVTGPSVAASTVGWGNIQESFGPNESTTMTWTTAQINTGPVQIGMKSLT